LDLRPFGTSSIFGEFAVARYSRSQAHIFSRKGTQNIEAVGQGCADIAGPPAHYRDPQLQLLRFNLLI
jgi:hypothetical protein